MLIVRKLVIITHGSVPLIDAWLGIIGPCQSLLPSFFNQLVAKAHYVDVLWLRFVFDF